MKVRNITGGVARAISAASLLIATVGAGTALADHDGGPPPSPTLYVGNCVKPSPYTTISEAVAAASPGATILVCPGVYPEQVTINKPLTIQGIQYKNSDAVIITGTETANAADFDNGGSLVVAQILVENTANVNLINLITDGSSNVTSPAITGCGTDLIGILFQNASGSINSVAVRNEALAPGLAGCQDGQGIFVETGNAVKSTGQQSVVTITNTSVHDFDKNGITGDDAGTYLYVGNSSIVGYGAANFGDAAQNGIQIAYGATGQLNGNNLANFDWAPDVFGDTGDAATGILIYASSNVQVIDNVVTNSQYSIFVGSGTGGFENGSADRTVIENNIISATHLYDAIDLCSNGNFANLNQIFATDEAAIHLDDTCPGSAHTSDATSGDNNDVTLNTINEACIGVMSGPTATGNRVGELFSNVVNLTLTGETASGPFCTPPQSTFSPVAGNSSLVTTAAFATRNSAAQGKPSTHR